MVARALTRRSQDSEAGRAGNLRLSGRQWNIRHCMLWVRVSSSRKNLKHTHWMICYLVCISKVNKEKTILILHYYSSTILLIIQILLTALSSQLPLNDCNFKNRRTDGTFLSHCEVLNPVTRAIQYLQSWNFMTFICLRLTTCQLCFKTLTLIVCSNANPLHYYALQVPHKTDRWHGVWSIFESWTAWADHITCGTSICIVYWRKLRLGWLYV